MTEFTVRMTPHDGGKMPVPEGTFVAVQRESGEFHIGKAGDVDLDLENFFWVRDEYSTWNIVAYAVLKIEGPGE